MLSDSTSSPSPSPSQSSSFKYTVGAIHEASRIYVVRDASCIACCKSSLFDGPTVYLNDDD